jgi:F0F1-type ATP synthase assembly protein I
MKIRPTPSSDHSGANEGWAVISTLIGGFVLWGGIGWLLDHWWGTRFATPVGLIIGMVLGIYAVVARAGHPAPAVTRPTDPQPGPPPASTRRETE